MLRAEQLKKEPRKPSARASSRGEGNVILGEKLADLRRKFGLKPVDVIEATGIARGSLAMVETGKAMPTVLMLVTLATFYEVSLDDLTAHMRPD